MRLGEEWRPITGYEGLYEVSNLGRFRSLDRIVEYERLGIRQTKTHPGIILSPKIMKNGYVDIAFSKNGVLKHYRAHRVVAKEFVDNPFALPEVNHIDGDKTNNAASNLEWCSRSENTIHAYRSGLQTRVSRGRLRKIVCLDDGAEFYSSGEAAEHYGVPSGTIMACCKRKSRGRVYTFRFAERENEPREAKDDG